MAPDLASWRLPYRLEANTVLTLCQLPISSAQKPTWCLNARIREELAMAPIEQIL
ncbi:hypothetical protein Syun_001536 [Stephania yunnanensis]|uniref:Uncharacterized protein n=1 Tax=Stephania yunnanensis TaxID=152371 RepID=A0AAP0LEA9_9MAGN